MRPLLVLAASVLWLACSADEPSAADAAADAGPDATAADPDRGAVTDAAPPVDECAPVGATTCAEEDNALLTCVAASGDPAQRGARWSAPAPCAAGSYCRQGACQAPTAAQLQQATALEGMVDHLAGTTGWIDDLPIDVPGAKRSLRQILFSGDEGERAFFTAARAALLAFPIGHMGIYSSQDVCGSDAIPWQETSRLGACARSYQDHFIITSAVPSNPLQLQAGDRITAVDGRTGQEMIARVLRQPACGASSASAASRQMLAATSLLGVMPRGTELTVVAPDGASRTATIQQLSAASMWCRDPFGRDTQVTAEATLRADGVGVLRLPRFTPLGGFKGTTMAEIEAEMEALKQEIAAELAKLTGGGATGLVWDLRGNVGGATPVGLAIIGGMPGAKETFVAHCKSRVPYSTPPQWYGGENEFDYVVTVDPTAFPQPSKVAVLIDGMAISAADYFAYAVTQATTVPLVGSPPAGAYGGGGGQQVVSSAPPLTASTDPARCADAQDQALEGRSAQPTHPVDYDPQDLAAGVDTLLEAAAALVGGAP